MHPDPPASVKDERELQKPPESPNVTSTLMETTAMHSDLPAATRNSPPPPSSTDSRSNSTPPAEIEHSDPATREVESNETNHRIGHPLITKILTRKRKAYPTVPVTARRVTRSIGRKMSEPPIPSPQTEQRRILESQSENNGGSTLLPQRRNPRGLSQTMPDLKGKLAPFSDHLPQRYTEEAVAMASFGDQLDCLAELTTRTVGVVRQIHADQDAFCKHIGLELPFPYIPTLKPRMAPSPP